MNALIAERRRQLTWRGHIIVLLALAIILWGLAAVYHSQALTGEWERYLVRQSLWVVLALVLGRLISLIPFAGVLQLAPYLGTASLLTLAALPVIGVRINGMGGWFHWGGVMVQPSEVVKGIYLLWLVQIFARRDWDGKLRTGYALGVMGMFLVLLLLQPDLGTAAVYAAGTLAVMFVMNMPLVHVGAAAALLATGAGAALLRFGYMRARLVHFFQPELDPSGGGWHLHQFAIAVARGGWFGVKSDMAVWSAGFLPLSHNDSVFAAMCELLGFCGAALLLMLYAALFFQLFMLAAWRRDPVRRAFIESVALMLLAQTALHVLVNLGLLPPTGVTLPLVSYGGSSLLGTMLMLGLALSAAGE